MDTDEIEGRSDVLRIPRVLIRMDGRSLGKVLSSPVWAALVSQGREPLVKSWARTVRSPGGAIRLEGGAG